MIDLGTIRDFLHYNDAMNDRILAAAVRVPSDGLDRPFEMGMGSLRRTLIHILAGESVWVRRWQGLHNTPWPDESVRHNPADIGREIAGVRAERDNFLRAQTPGTLAREITYRDSKGSYFSATLGDMMMQMCLHSTHHRAQAVNMLRQLGAEAPEVDYMMWLRKPAQAPA